MVSLVFVSLILLSSYFFFVSLSHQFLQLVFLFVHYIIKLLFQFMFFILFDFFQIFN